MPEDPQKPRRRPSQEGNAGRDSDDRRAEREWARLSGLVYEFIGYLLVLGYLGWRLDESRDLGGMGLFGGLLLALGAWIYRVLRVTRNLFK